MKAIQEILIGYHTKESVPNDTCVAVVGIVSGLIILAYYDQRLTNQ